MSALPGYPISPPPNPKPAPPPPRRSVIRSLALTGASTAVRFLSPDSSRKAFCVFPSSSIMQLAPQGLLTPTTMAGYVMAAGITAAIIDEAFGDLATLGWVVRVDTTCTILVVEIF